MLNSNIDMSATKNHVRWLLIWNICAFCLDTAITLKEFRPIHNPKSLKDYSAMLNRSDVYNSNRCIERAIDILALYLLVCSCRNKKYNTIYTEQTLINYMKIFYCAIGLFSTNSTISTRHYHSSTQFFMQSLPNLYQKYIRRNVFFQADLLST